MMVIVNDVPPPRRRKPERGYTATIRRLMPGQSVLLPCKPNNAHQLALRVFQKEDFVVRAEGRGSRIWRK